MVKQVVSRHLSAHAKGSVHSGVSPNTSIVRMRHPEFAADVPVKEGLTILDELGGAPNDGALDIDRPCIPSADLSCYMLDGFDRVAQGGTWEASVDGGAWGGPSRYQTLERDLSAFEFYATPYGGDVWSSTGSRAYAWTENPGLGCSGLSFTLAGWMEKEAWYAFTVPAHPTDMAGMTFGSLTFNAWTGIAGGTVGQAEGATVVVASSPPGALRHGTPVAHLAHTVASTVFIPGEYIPAEGGTLYIGVRPNWVADYGAVYCGFRWPWMNGANNSAKAGVNVPLTGLTIAWQSYSVAADGWGSGADDDDGAWWEGNLPWLVGSTGGSWGMDGNHLYLTAASGAQQIMTATMAGTSEVELADANDDAVGEPWTQTPGVAMKARLKVTTAGVVGEAGSRYVRFRWADSRDELTLELKLGDPQFAEGLLVYDGDGYTVAENYVAKPFSNTAYVWVMLDSRNPDYLKAKLWDESGTYGGGEPAKYDVFLARDEGAENPVSRDYFEVVISAGNMTGADQTVQIDAIYFCGSGEDCEWAQEYMGVGDGTTHQFYTAQAFKPESLWWFVDGMHVRSLVLSAGEGRFTSPLGLSPAVNANLVARYLIDTDPEGD